MKNPHEAAAVYAQSKGWLTRELGPRAPQEISMAYVAGFNACSGEIGERAAPLVAEARARERARIKAIIKHREAVGRDAEQVEHIAFDTDMTPQAAGAMLTKSPASKKGGLIDPKVAVALLRGAGVANAEQLVAEKGVLGILHAGEAVPSIRNEPAHEPAGPPQINPQAIFAARAAASKAKPGDRPAA